MKTSLIREVHQAVLGIPNTEDKGLVGDIKEIKTHLEDHSRRLVIVETLQKERNKPSKKAITGYISGGAAIVAALWKTYLG